MFAGSPLWPPTAKHESSASTGDKSDNHSNTSKQAGACRQHAAKGCAKSAQEEAQVSGLLGREPESQPESRPESMEIRVLQQLASQPLVKDQLSEALGQKAISGQLNKVIRVLVADETIEPTIPEKPNSRLQKYRLTDRGRAVLEQWRNEGEKS